ncbi:hypothetical protein [Catenulispora rubra]|uniref:hypothetical protein n=1 Tax=Catenulispora rubra TaxID=280293 RepID=UPI0018922DB3|nr:hypothetical protein [Catenulispora rubra]
MDLVLVRLSAPNGGGVTDRHPDPEAVADILWANAAVDDRLEHIRARHGPTAGSFDLALFYRSGPASPTELAECLCHRTITASPALDGWVMTIPFDIVTCSASNPSGDSHVLDFP